jgi:hypothetical protein
LSIRLALCSALALAVLAAVPASAQLVLKNEDVNIRFGVLGQFQGDWSQDSTAGSQGYQQNLFLRRARLIMGGDLGSQISFFFETDDPNLGKTPKALNSGFILLDGFVEWKPTKVFQVEGGLMLVPASRQALQSPVSYLTADVSAVSTISNTATQSSVLRDAGFGARGYFHNDHLQYRMGVFSGERDASAHNSPRAAGYLQYDFFEPEKVYVYSGTSLGKKKILAVDIGGDTQGAYRSYSANIANQTPVRGGDEVGLNLQYLHFDGGTKFLTIPDQNNFLAEAGYYIHKAKIQPFGKFETQRFVAPVNSTKDIDRCGAGANYYIRGQNLKWTVQYQRALPQNGSPLKPANEFTLQLQAFYF